MHPTSDPSLDPTADTRPLQNLVARAEEPYISHARAVLAMMVTLCAKFQYTALRRYVSRISQKKWDLVFVSHC